MTIAVIFLIIFIVGPFTFQRLTVATPSREALRFLGGFVFATALGGLLLRFALDSVWGRGVTATAASLTLLWFAWIGVLALGAQALRRSEPSLRMHKWTGMIGSVGTTVPWFGLALATYLIAK